MASDPRIDVLSASNDNGESQERASGPSAVRVLMNAALGGVISVFSFDPTKEFTAVNDNRSRFLAQVTRVVPDVRPAQTAPAFAAAKIDDVPPPVPQSGLTRFADRAMPEFDLRPTAVDPLDADPFGLDAAANDNGTAPAITRIRA